MDSGLPRNTFIERRIDDAHYIFVIYPVCMWILSGIFIRNRWEFLKRNAQKLTLKNLKNKVIFNYYHLLSKIK